MGILEKLRPQPRWKHTDPSVRAAAVYELGPDEAEALHALAREDAEPRVRRAAATRIDDPSVLADIAKTDPDEDVRAEAIRGIAGIAAETDDLPQALDAVRHISAPDSFISARTSMAPPYRGSGQRRAISSARTSLSQSTVM